MSTMDQAAPEQVGGHNDQHDQVSMTVEALRMLLAKIHPDPMEHAQYGFTAAAVLAGIVYSHMVAAGVESNNRPRRKVIEAVLVKNFRAGIDIGLRAASRIADEQGSRQ